MKRGNIVLNRKLFKTGKDLATWASTGMNWAPGEGREATIRQGKTVLASPILRQTLAVCHEVLLSDLGQEGSQSTVSATLAAIVDGNRDWRISLLSADYNADHPRRIGSEQEPITCPDGEDWGTRTIENWSDGSSYNLGYRAGGTWVDGWWS